MSAAGHSERRCSFGGVADAYDRGRPEYPLDAVDWIVGGTECPVLDVGAGTGKLTSALLGAGRTVIALEPDPLMRQAFARALPGTRLLAGSAERVPLADGAVAVVTAGQAFHWFDLDRALPELARVLRPDGRLGVIWNFRDESVPWVAELGAALRIGAPTGGPVAVTEDELTEDWQPWFEPVARARFRHEHQLDVPTLVDLAASRSHTATLDERTRAVLLGEVARIGEAAAIDGMLRLPYAVHCLRAGRR